MTTCATCTHWQPKKSGEMAKHRMAICDLGPRWEFLPPHATCQKHRPADAQTVAARTKWLEKR